MGLALEGLQRQQSHYHPVPCLLLVPTWPRVGAFPPSLLCWGAGGRHPQAGPWCLRRGHRAQSPWLVLLSGCQPTALWPSGSVPTKGTLLSLLIWVETYSQPRVRFDPTCGKLRGCVTTHIHSRRPWCLLPYCRLCLAWRWREVLALHGKAPTPEIPEERRCLGWK